MPATHAFRRLPTQLFYNLKYFYCFDPFHDFAQSGIISKVLTPIIKIYYIDGPNFRRDLIGFEVKKKKLLQKFKQLKHRNGMISDIDKDGQMFGTGTQVIDFFLLFGYLDECVDRSSDRFKIYLQIRNIYLFVMSEKIAKIKLDLVDEEVKLFLFEYHRIFQANKMESLTPKLHHLEHYVSCMRKMGNPKFFGTIRYERKHQDPKRNESNSRQFQNKPYSVAKWEALTRRVEFKLVDECVVDYSKFNFNNPDNRFYFKFLDEEKEFVRLKHVKISKIDFKLGRCFRLIDEGNSSTNFVEIVEMFQQDEQCIIIGSCLKSVSYNTHKCAYSVEYENELMKVDVDQIFHSQLIFIKNEMLLIKDFSLDDDF